MRELLLWQLLDILRQYRLARMAYPTFYPESGWTR